jgi:tetratricopeptide (TPR) repeat protein
MYSLIKIKIVILLMLLSLSTIAFSQTKTISKENWIEDMNYLLLNLKENHPHIYYRVSMEDFNKAVVKTRNEIINSDSDIQAYYALKKLVAVVQDGHTQLYNPTTINIDNLRFPFRLDQFSDGVFITVVEENKSELLGSKLQKVNNIPIEEVLDISAQICNMDNKFGRIRSALQNISFPRIMLGLGIIENDNEIELSLITRTGENKTIIFKSITDSTSVLWSNRLNEAPSIGKYVNAATLLGDGTPLHLQKQDTNVKFYWFKHLESERAIYFQYNQVANQPGNPESWYEYNDKMWSYIDSDYNNIDKLIIDIRYNDGGNGRTLTPLINQIIRHEKFCNGENLYILMGKRTYSAAVIFLYELWVHTDAIFVGSPSACPYNFFSNRRTTGRLPNCNATIGVASRQIDNARSHQTDYLSPDIPAPFSSSDYFNGKDPGLSAALNAVEMLSISEFASQHGTIAAQKYYQRMMDSYGDLDWWLQLKPVIVENDINGTGYYYMGNGDMKTSFELFKLNTLIFPTSHNVWDSFAEWYLNSKDYNSAIKYYNMTLKLDPVNENAKSMLLRINDEISQINK